MYKTFHDLFQFSNNNSGFSFIWNLKFGLNFISHDKHFSPTQGILSSQHRHCSIDFETEGFGFWDPPCTASPPRSPCSCGSSTARRTWTPCRRSCRRSWCGTSCASLTCCSSWMFLGKSRTWIGLPALRSVPAVWRDSWLLCQSFWASSHSGQFC